MRTEKLYDLDSHRRSFTAEVLSCTPCKGGWEVLLNQTAFYPEGGGQPCDHGTLGGTTVTQVQECEGAILHTCSSPLAQGSQVTGKIDWDRRFDLMQQHSGEHIVSGLIHAAYGFENVGFHMGQDRITIDFNGELNDSQLHDIEAAANDVVWRNLPVRVSYPDAKTLLQLPYRSKKALTGAVRIVEYPGVDLCACCGTHVAQTGEIGLILLLNCVKFRGGVRIDMFCGKRAVAYTRAVLSENHRISNLLSAKPLQTAASVQRMQDELAQAKYRVVELEDRLFAQISDSLLGTGDVLLFEPGLAPDGIRRFAVAAADASHGRAAVFSGSDEQGYKYALCWPDGDLRQLCRDLNASLNGRGGGKAGFMQGSVQATRDEIQKFFKF